MISGTCRRGVSGTQPCECHRCQPPVFLARRAPRTSAAAHAITQETLVTPNTDQWLYSSLTTPKTSSKSDHESGDLHKTAICPGVHLHRDTKGKNQQGELICPQNMSLEHNNKGLSHLQNSSPGM